MDEYEIEINGMTTTLQLSEAEAEARGLKKASKSAPASKEAKAPANKAAPKPSTKANG